MSIISCSHKLIWPYTWALKILTRLRILFRGWDGKVCVQYLTSHISLYCVVIYLVNFFQKYYRCAQMFSMFFFAIAIVWYFLWWLLRTCMYSTSISEFPSGPVVSIQCSQCSNWSTDTAQAIGLVLILLWIHFCNIVFGAFIQSTVIRLSYSPHGSHVILSA